MTLSADTPGGESAAVPGSSEHSEQPLTGKESEKAKAYNRTRRILFIVELAFGLVFLMFLLLSGLSLILARWLEASVGNVWLVILLYLVILGLAYDVVGVPLDFYGGFVIEHRYGQSTQTFRAWAWDQLKGMLVSFAIGAPLMEGLYWLLRSYPQGWWFIASIVFVALAIVMANLAPVILIPIFYKLVPLRDEELKRRIIELCKKANTRVRGVYEMDMSRKTKAANAALVGLGNTRRIVLGDTLLSRYEPDEVEVVLAHELGHHKNWDMWQGLVFQSAISFLGFYVAYLILNAFSASFGFRGPSDIASFPLLALVFAVISLVFLPAANGFSRRLERRADAFALRLTRNPQAFISMMAKLGEQNLAEFEPNRIIEFILYSHPSIKKRIQQARQMLSETPAEESQKS